MDKFIVRFAILSLNVYMISVIALAYMGIDISVYDYLFTDSLLFGIVLTTLCHTQGRYHCVWMRALCYNLIAIPILNFIDANMPLFETIEGYLYAIAAIVSINVIATIILAINHFRRVRKATKGRYEELRPIKCNCQRKDR